MRVPHQEACRPSRSVLAATRSGWCKARTFRTLPERAYQGPIAFISTTLAPLTWHFTNPVLRGAPAHGCNALGRAAPSGTAGVAAEGAGPVPDQLRPDRSALRDSGRRGLVQGCDEVAEVAPVRAGRPDRPGATYEGVADQRRPRDGLRQRLGPVRGCKGEGPTGADGGELDLGDQGLSRGRLARSCRPARRDGGANPAAPQARRVSSWHEVSGPGISHSSRGCSLPGSGPVGRWD